MLNKFRRQRQRRFRMRSLCGSDVILIDRPPDRESRIQEVDVTPLQTQDLANTET